MEVLLALKHQVSTPAVLVELSAPIKIPPCKLSPMHSLYQHRERFVSQTRESEAIQSTRGWKRRVGNVFRAPGLGELTYWC